MSYDPQYESRTKYRWLCVLRDKQMSVSVVARKYDDIWMLYVMQDGRTIQSKPVLQQMIETAFNGLIGKIQREGDFWRH